jgi:hypothetical protein
MLAQPLPAADRSNAVTLTMADSISADSLPPGYDAYAGYVDGAWPDFPAIAAKFPNSYLYSISATGEPADEYDVEIGDLSPASGVAHVQADLAAGKWRPGIYASVSTMASGVLPALAAAGVARQSSRLRSAHYGAGEHICGPATCNLVSIPMDATQWTDSAPGVGGALIDASILVADFFAGPPALMPPFSTINEEVRYMQLTITGEVYPLRFPVWPAFVFLFADFLGQTETSVPIRVALHRAAGGWDVRTVELSPAVPGVTLSMPATTYDAASFVREADGPNVAVSWR